MLSFVLFSLLFSLFYYMHFHVAVIAWKRLKGTTSSELDNDYVRLEDYFGQSFRSKLQQWLQLPEDPSSSQELGVIDKGGEKIYVANDVDYPSNHDEVGMIVAEGEFLCGAYCHFEKEIFVRENCIVGPSCELQALAVDGTTRLDPGTKVRRWVDSKGFLNIGGNCRILSRATSRASIRLGPGAQVKSLFAPEVATQGQRADTGKWEESGGPLVELSAPVNAGEIKGLDPARMIPMGDCYRYEGDLILQCAVHLTVPLIVRGDFQCYDESLIDADVKASGAIFIGDGSIVKSSLVAGGNLILGRGAVFQGVLHSGGAMRLRHGVRGLREGSPVAAHAEGPMFVESNCVINGKLSSAKYVEASVTPIDWFESATYNPR